MILKNQLTQILLYFLLCWPTLVGQLLHGACPFVWFCCPKAGELQIYIRDFHKKSVFHE